MRCALLLLCWLGALGCARRTCDDVRDDLSAAVEASSSCTSDAQCVVVDTDALVGAPSVLCDILAVRRGSEAKLAEQAAALDEEWREECDGWAGLSQSLGCAYAGLFASSDPDHYRGLCEGGNCKPELVIEP